MNIKQGSLLGNQLKVGIVAGRFNDFIVQKLIDGAIDCLVRHGVNEKHITIVRSPGAFEIPLLSKKLVQKEDVNGVIALGAIIRGSTSHYDLICAEVTKGLAHLSLEAEKPVIMGIVTTDSIEQAIERAGTKNGNKGFDAALALIEMCNVLRSI